MKPQTTNKKNIAKFTAALFALILLFPCCMDSGSSGDSGDYDSGNSTENNGNWENPDDNNNTDDNTGDDSTKPDEPNPDTPDDSETTTEIDSNTDMSTLVPTKNISSRQLMELLMRRSWCMQKKYWVKIYHLRKLM